MTPDQFLTDFLKAFLPLFVAVNVLGILPLFIGLTEGMTNHQRHKLAVQAVAAAFIVALLILFAGEFIFKTLGITVNDLRVGGGLILLVLSISDLLFSDYKRRAPDSDGGSDGGSGVGIVPLGIPLVIGPAAITTIIVSEQNYGYPATLASLTLNLLLVLVLFLGGPMIMRKLGENTSKAVAKVASLFLAAISIAMIRTGIVEMIAVM